eukprot:216554-Chlamydomonas_euryale.AAC.1
MEHVRSPTCSFVQSMPHLPRACALPQTLSPPPTPPGPDTPAPAAARHSRAQGTDHHTARVPPASHLFTHTLPHIPQLASCLLLNPTPHPPLGCMHSTSQLFPPHNYQSACSLNRPPLAFMHSASHLSPSQPHLPQLLACQLLDLTSS